MQTGLDRLLHDAARLARLRGQRVALLSNSASMTSVDLGSCGLDQTLRIDEDAWAEERRRFLIYG